MNHLLVKSHIKVNFVTCFPLKVKIGYSRKYYQAIIPSSSEYSPPFLYPRFILAFPKFSMIGESGWRNIFGLIRSSEWAKNNGITDVSFYILIYQYMSIMYR